jgi:hypothetical protein
MIETAVIAITSIVTIASILANLTGKQSNIEKVERFRVQLHKLVSLLAINLKK